MKTNDRLESVVLVIYGGAADFNRWKHMQVWLDLSQGRSMSADFSVIAMDRVDLDDKRVCRRLHDDIGKFSRQGIVKTGEWGEFDRHDQKKEGY